MSDVLLTPLAPLLSNYLNTHVARVRKLSAKTMESYSTSIRLFLEFFHEHEGKPFDRIVLEDITYDAVTEFICQLEDDRGNGANTCNLRLSAIRSFCKWAGPRVPKASEECARIALMSSKRREIPQVGFLTIEEVQALLSAPQISTYEGVHDRAMLLLTYVCALRASETLNLTLDRVELHHGLGVHVLGKGNRARVLPFDKKTRKVLKSYIDARPRIGSDAFFVDRGGSPTSYAAFLLRIKKYAEIAAEHMPSIRHKHVTPHILRHSCAMDTLTNTGDIRRVSLWLGHACIRTTEMYLHADPAEKLAILETQTDLGIKAGKFDIDEPEILRILRAATQPGGAPDAFKPPRSTRRGRKHREPE